MRLFPFFVALCALALSGCSQLPYFLVASAPTGATQVTGVVISDTRAASSIEALSEERVRPLNVADLTAGGREDRPSRRPAVPRSAFADSISPPSEMHTGVRTPGEPARVAALRSTAARETDATFGIESPALGMSRPAPASTDAAAHDLHRREVEAQQAWLAERERFANRAVNSVCVGC
jgi:hypothetical protein